jgi:hypothetical protein
MTQDTPFKFKIGDRVAEKPCLKLNVCNRRNKEAIKRFKEGEGQRYGVVVSMSVHKNARGSKRKFVEVLWDGKQSPSLHEQMRLCLASEIVSETHSGVQAIG